MVPRVNVVSACENLLVRYQAYDEAEKRTRLVVFRRMFGRVRQLWILDMGLGPIEWDFGALIEEAYDDLMMEAGEEADAVVEISDEDSDDEEIVEGVPAAQEIEREDVQMVMYDVNREAWVRGATCLTAAWISF